MTGLPPEYAWLDPQDRALIDDAISALSKLPKEKKGEAYFDISKRLRVLRRHLGRTSTMKRLPRNMNDASCQIS